MTWKFNIQFYITHYADTGICSGCPAVGLKLRNRNFQQGALRTVKAITEQDTQ